MPKTSWFRRLVRFFAAEQPTAAQQSRDAAFPRMYPIRLEDRQVLDGVPLIQLDPQGMVTVTAGADANDGKADSFEANRIDTESGSFLQIKVNDRTAAEFRLDDVKQLRFEGSQDADTLKLDAGAVPIGGVEFVGNAIPAPVGSPTGTPGDATTAGVDRLILSGSPPTGLSGGASGSPTSPASLPLVYRIDASAATLSTSDGAWQVVARDVERIVDPLSVDDRQVFVGAGLDATLRGGDGMSAGWTTIETVTGPTVELQNSLASLSVTATNVRVTGRVELLGGDLTLSAVDALTVTQSGELISGGGTVVMNAPQVLVQGVVDVGPSGLLRIDVGSTGLLTVGGTLRAVGTAAGEHGGRIELRGDFVRLTSTARIDATGDAGGGQVLLGSSGDTSVDAVVGSRGVWIELGATVDVSATRNGDGGRLIVWGTEGIVVDGLLRAAGGDEGGNGGFIETSTHGVFSITAAPVLFAPHGHGGEWLIDPIDLEIVSGAGSSGFTATGGPSTPVFTTDPTHNQLGVATLLAAMGNGVTVELKTGNPTAGDGNITLNTDLDYNGKGTGTLKFTAHHSIILNNRIYDSDTGTTDKLNVILAAGSDGLGTSSTQLNANVATNGGAFVSTGDNFTQAGATTLATAGGAIQITTTAGKSITLNGGASAGAGAITLTADDLNFGGPAGSIVGTGPIVLQQVTPTVQIGLGGGTGAFSLSTTDLGALADGFAQITIGRGNGTGGINLLATTFRDPVRLQSPTGGTINVDGTLTGTDNASIVIDGAGTTTVLSANIVTAGTAVTFSDNVQVDAAVTIDTTNGGAVATGANVTFQGTLDATAAVTPESLVITAGTSGDVIFTGAVGSTEKLDSLNITGDVVLFSSSVATFGALTVASAGAMTFTGPVTTTTAGNITLTNGGLLTIPVGATMTAAGTFTQNGAGNVSLGANVLTASGAISFASPVSVVAAITINSATSGTGANVTFSSTVDATAAVTAESLTVNAGTTGDVTFTGAVGATQKLDSLNVTGDVVLFSSSVGTAGVLKVVSAGTMTFTGPVTTTTGGNITLTNGGLLTIPAGATMTSAGAFTQNGAGNVSLGANVLTASGAISFASPVAVVAAITINSAASGTGANVTFSSTVDATAAATPESLTVSAGTTGDVTFTGAVGGTEKLDSLNVTGDVVLFSAAVAVTGVLTVVSAGTMTFTGPVTTTTAGGNITLTNGGLLTIPVGATMTSAGTFTQNGAGNVSLGADVLTASGAISFASPVSVVAAITINSATSGTGADVSFASTVNATAAVTAESLTVNAGTTGDVTFTGAVGATQKLDSLSVSGDVVLFSSSVGTTGALTVVSAGTMTFTGPVTTTAGGNITLTNGGLLTIPVGATMTSAGTFTQNGAGNVRLGANVLTASGAISFASPVAVVAAITVNSATSGTGADITFASTVNATAALTAESLTVKAGTTGDVTFTGAVGGTEQLDSLNVTGDVVLFSAAVAVTGALTVVSAGTMTFTGPVTTTAAGGDITLTNGGLLTVPVGATMTSAGTFTQNGAGNVSLGADVLTASGAISFASPVSVVAAITINSATSGTGADVSFASTVNATAALTAESLTVNAGTTGDVTFTGAVGGTQKLDSLSVTGDVVLFSSSVGTTGALTVVSAGAMTFGGAVTTTAAGGDITLTNGGLLTIQAGATMTSAGTFTQNGAGNVRLGADVLTASGAISFASPVAVAAAITINSATSGTGAEVTFASTVDATSAVTAESLTVNAGTTGDVTFTGAVGGTQKLDSLNVTGDVVLFSSSVATFGALTVVSADTTTFTGPVTTTAAGGDITLTNGGLLTIPIGATMTAAGTFTQNGAGNVSLGADVLTASGAISFASPVSIVAAITINSANSGTGANVTFSSTVDATAAVTPESLTVNAGTNGDVTFTGAVGGTQKLDSLDVTGKVVLFSSSVTTTGALTVVSAGAMTFTGPVTTTSAGGDITLTNGGLLTIPVGATMTSAGTFTQNGAASVSLGADVLTASGAISFARPVAVVAAVTINSATSGTGANVTFSNTVNATAAGTAESLTVNAGTAGDVTFTGAVGGTQKLDSLNVTGDVVLFSSSAATFGALTVVSAGTMTFGGAVTTTTAGSDITLTNGGLLTIQTGATMTSAGAFTQNGAGNVRLGADVLTASGAISFASPVAVVAAITINSATSGTGANVTLASTVDATAAGTPESLTVKAGTAGDVTFTGAVGATQKLDSLNVTGDVVLFSSSVATTGALTVVSAGTMTFTGPITTTGAGGDITLTNGGLLTIPVGATVTSAGKFKQDGAGNVSLGADVLTASGAISFASPVSIVAAITINSATSGTGANVTFSSTVDATAAVTAESLTVNAGTVGDVTFTGAVGGAEPLDTLSVTGDIVLFSATVDVIGALTVVSAGTMTFNGSVTTTAATGDITLTNAGVLTIAPGATITAGGTFTQNGTGGVTLGADVVTSGATISFTGPITVTQNVLVDSTSGAPAGANITFGSTINATAAATPESLTVRAGTAGDVLFSGNIGSVQPLDALDVAGHVVTFTGTVAVAGPLTVVSADAMTFNGAVTTTTPAGAVLLTNGGLLTIASGATVTTSGAFTQNGAGDVSLGASVRTASAPLSFSSPVALTQNVVLKTTQSGAGADITLGSDVVGTTAAETLTLDAGAAGDISAQALGVGAGVQRLGGLVITAADDVTATSIASAGGLTSTSNTLTVTGLTDSSGAPVTITVNHAGPGPALRLQGVNVHGQNLTISSAGEVQFLGGAESVASSGPAGGTFTLQGTAVGTTIGLGTGAAGALRLDDASVDAIGAGFTGGIVFGRSAQSGKITFSGPNHSYDQNVTIRATGGATVDLGASLDTIEGGAVGKTITISGAAGTSLVLLGGNLSTDGGAIQITGGTLRVVGPATRSLVTSGAGGTAATAGDVDLNGLTLILGDSTGGLAIDSRHSATNDGLANDGRVDLPATIGSVAPGNTLTRLDVRTDQGTTVLANNGGATTIRIAGTAGSTSLFLNGSVRMTGNTTMSVTPGDVDVSEAIFSSSGGTARSLTISTVDGGAGADGVVRLGETDAAGGLKVSNITITTADGGAAGALVFDHPGATLDIDILGDFTHVGQRVVVADDTNLTTNGQDIALAGNIDASAAGLVLNLNGSGGAVGGLVDPGPIGNFGAFGVYGGGFYLSEVRLSTNHTGSVRLNDDITIDDPAGTSAGVVIQGRTQVAADVTIRTEAGNDNRATPIDLSGANVFADIAGHALTLNASGGAFSGGDVTLGQFGDGGSGRFVRNLLINNTGAPAGDLRLTGDVLLDDAGIANPAALTYVGGDVIVTASLLVDTEQGLSAPGGMIDFGGSTLSASTIDRTLTLDARGAGSGGDIIFKSTGAAGGAYLGGLVLRTNSTGTVRLQGDLLTDATPAIPGAAGVTIVGDVFLVLPGGSVWKVDTEQGNNGPSSPINLDQATMTALNANTDVALDASGTATAGAVTLGGFTPLPGGQRVRNLTITAAGDVTFTDLAKVNGAIAVTDSRNIAIQQNLDAPSMINLQADGQISGAGTLITNNLSLTAGGAIRGPAAASPLQVATPLLAANSTGGGDVRIANTFANPVTITTLQTIATGNVVYQQTGGGSLTVTGPVSTINGDISLTNSGANVLMTVAGTVSTNNGDISLTSGGAIVLGGSSTLSTTGGGTQIVVQAGGTLTMQPGGVITVGTAAANPGRLEHIPPATSVSSPPPGGPNVDGEGNTSINVAIGDAIGPVEQGFDVTIDWGDGPVQVVNNVNGATASFSHHYDANPNPDQLAPILVTVTVNIDPRIILTQNGVTPVEGTTTEILLSVTGTFFAFVAITPTVIVPPPRITAPTVAFLPPPARPAVAVAARPLDVRSTTVSFNPAQERQYLLRIVTTNEANLTDSELPLSEEELNDLPGLFRRLPDGRYQIWLILEDSSRQLVRDCYVRDGKAIDLEDLGIEPGTPEPVDEGNPQGPAAGGEVDKNPLRNVPDPFEDSNASEAPRGGGEPSTAPPLRAPAGRGDVDREARIDWSERAREALATTDERAYSKARRLLRRGSV